MAAFCIATTTASLGQTFDSHDLAGTEGGNPAASLVQGFNGNLYGTTSNGGANGAGGTVFVVSPLLAVTTLYNFCSQANCADGNSPQGPLAVGADGNLYGTTAAGGVNNNSLCNNAGCGTVFKITPTGSLTILYSFCAQANCADGAAPFGGLVQGVDGNFYGTTIDGGTGCAGCGTVFKITASGTLTTLYSFCSQTKCTDGRAPRAGLILANNGTFYGTTMWGGLAAVGLGTVFEITPAGKLTTLYNFCSQANCIDGSQPFASLIQGTDGNLYGTTPFGGAQGQGVIFKITLGGKLTTVYNFCPLSSPCADGALPVASLSQASDGNFYGTTEFGGGPTNAGTVFELTSAGTLTTLYDFCPSGTGCTDGGQPTAALMQSTNGTFYGTAQQGGTNGTGCAVTCGTVFSLSTGLGHFVEANPTFSKVGKTVSILGNNLTGTTSVSFNGTPATFTVVSGTRLKATVPVGATSGTIRVNTPGGTLSSNGAFTVMP